MAAVHGGRRILGTQLDWSVSDRCQLMLLAGDGTRPYNRAAMSLAGPHALNLRGDLLLLALDAKLKVTSLLREELLLICTRLLVGEAAAGALG